MQYIQPNLLHHFIHISPHLLHVKRTFLLMFRLVTSTFEWLDVRRQHYVQSQDHHSCGDCNRFFSSEELRMKHAALKHLYCRVHDTVRLSVLLDPFIIETDDTALIRQIFKSEDDLVSHYRQSLEHP